MDYLTTKEMSSIWGISPTRITILAKNKRIPGAKQIGARWFIPTNTKKPLDNRFNSSKENNESFFRFPFFPGADEDSFNPALSEEELELKKISESFLECQFENLDQRAKRIIEKTDNIYIKITAHFFYCVIELVLNKYYEFYDCYKRLINIFEKDFPHKAEMFSLVVDLNLVAGNAGYCFKNNLVKEGYKVDDSFLSHLATYPTLKLYYSAEKKFSIHDTDSLTIDCRFVEKYGNPLDAQSIHFYLGFIFASLGEKESSNYHFIESFKLAEKYKFYWLPASEYYYLGKIMDEHLSHFPKTFRDKIKSLSKIINKKVEDSLGILSYSNAFSYIPRNQFIYVFYALKRYSNKEIASLLNVSEKTVSKKYSEIYHSFNVTKKDELVNHCLKLLSQTTDETFNFKK